MTETELIAALLDAANLLIAIGMERIGRESPERHKAIIEVSAAGAIPKLIIETHPDLTTINLHINRVNVMEFRSVRAQPLLH